jgi:hypothetical protein
MENEVFWGLTYRSVSATAYLDHSLKVAVGHFTKAPKHSIETVQDHSAQCWRALQEISDEN